MAEVSIVGVGWSGFRPSVPELSFREMMFEAAVKAYHDAGLDPRRDIDAFISCQEDYWEGIAISDEFAPEPIGGVLRPTFTVAGDGLQCLAQAFMLVRSGYFDVVAVESHAKPSDISSISGVYELAYDPLTLRPVMRDARNPYALIALDAVIYMHRRGVSREHFALAAVKNKRNGLANPRASYASGINLETVLSGEYQVYPFTRHEIAPFTDAAVVMVVARKNAVREPSGGHVIVRGVGWSTEAGTGAFEWHELGSAVALKDAASMAYKLAGVDAPANWPSLVEVEDRVSFLELLSIESLGVAVGEPHKLLESGFFDRDGTLPSNPSGGSLSTGVALEATGLSRLLDAVLQLRGQAGAYQVSGAERAIVASWRGPPTSTWGVALLSRE